MDEPDANDRAAGNPAPGDDAGPQSDPSRRPGDDPATDSIPDSAGGDNSPPDGSSGGTDPGEETPTRETPSADAPAVDVPTDDRPADHAPADGGTVENPPDDGAVEQTPVGTAPVGESPVEETTAGTDSPGESASVEDASGEYAPSPSAAAASEGDGDSQSIEEMLLEFDDEEGLIRDRSLLDPNHVVSEDRIVGRDDQLQEVTKMLRVALGDNRPPNLFLYGPSGTGKSLITKAVCKNISQICESRDIRFGTIEVNCQDLDTLGVAIYELACRAADEAGTEVNVPKHGVATKEKWDEFYRIVNENFDSVVVVLDELDMLVGRRDKQEPAFSRLLYQLTRAGTNDDLTAHLSVVAISNDTKMMESVGSRALSSFTPEDVHFDDYDANQLKAILRRRRDAFYEDVLDDDVVPLTAAFAAQTHGDARKAIDLVRVAGELAEREGDDRVRERHVRAAQDKVEKNRVLEVVRGISTQKKLCLYATAAVAAETDAGSARSTTGYRVYQFLTDAIDADQYHQETYVNKMKELTTYSLVDFERRSHGPSSGMFLEFQFGERPETILETLREDSRIDMVAPEEVETVVKSQVRGDS